MLLHLITAPADPFDDQQTTDPAVADARNFYKVERWDAAELHVEELLHAGNRIDAARTAFAAAIAHRPRGRYLIRQRSRVLERWPR